MPIRRSGATRTPIVISRMGPRMAGISEAPWVARVLFVGLPGAEMTGAGLPGSKLLSIAFVLHRIRSRAGQSLIQHVETQHDQQRRPKTYQPAELDDLEIAQQEQYADHDQHDRPHRRTRGAAARQPARDLVPRIARAPKLRSVIRLERHIDIKARNHKPEQRTELRTSLCARDADHQAKNHDVNQALSVLAVVNCPYARNQSQQEGQPRRRSRRRGGGPGLASIRIRRRIGRNRVRHRRCKVRSPRGSRPRRGRWRNLPGEHLPGDMRRTVRAAINRAQLLMHRRSLVKRLAAIAAIAYDFWRGCSWGRPGFRGGRNLWSHYLGRGLVRKVRLWIGWIHRGCTLMSLFAGCAAS